jgi:hypothetical protein
MREHLRITSRHTVICSSNTIVTKVQVPKWQNMYKEIHWKEVRVLYLFFGKKRILLGRRRYFTRHPITGLNFNKTISKPYYNQAIL